MWMPAQTTTPPFASDCKACGTSEPTGAKMIAASNLFGRSCRRIARPYCAELLRELLGGVIAGPSERKDLPPLMPSNLGDDVGRRAEAVDSQPPGLTGHHERSIADQTGAQQRRSLCIRIPGGDRKAIPLVRDHVLRITAVDCVPRKAGEVAKILSPEMQYGHLPHVNPSQGTPTRSPTANRSTRSPSCTTTPTISCPGTSGNLGSGSSPSTTCKSVRQTPQA